MPGMVQQAKNLAGAGKRVVEAMVTPGQRVRAPEAVIAKRQEICRICPEKRPQEPVFGKKDRCRACGCVLSVKTATATEACPFGKWVAVADKEEFMEPATAQHLIHVIPAIRKKFQDNHVLVRLVDSFEKQKEEEQEHKKKRKRSCGSCKRSNSPEQLLLVHASNALKTLNEEDLLKLIEILPKNVYFKFRGNMRTVAEILEDTSK
jgi:hypothetical protein